MKITKNILKSIIFQELNLLSEATYTVKPRDSISKIAKEKGISVSAILRANSDKFDRSKVSDWERGDRPGPDDTIANTSGTRNPNWIYPGETIKIPPATPSRASTPAVNPGRPADAAVLPPEEGLETIVDDAAAAEYREDCKDSILAVLNALISVIDSMKERVRTGE